jgi:threonine-phosphate decarboxylase
LNQAHGGNIYLLAEKLGRDAQEIIDFSASINPLGVPESVLFAIRENMKCLVNYPDPDTKGLRLKIAEHTGVPLDSVLCGNGSTELIYLLVRALRPKRVLIPGPTFSEYERASLKIPGLQIVSHGLKREHDFSVDPEEFIRSIEGANAPGLCCDMAFLCNPNNPTGTLIKRDDMLGIADAAKRLKCTLVVDEAFIDFCPGDSVISETRGNPFLVVLRSLTKIYALSGLRVGYAVLPPSLVDAVKEAKEPWSVNTLAQIAGAVALDDIAYRTETTRVMATQKRVLEEGFKRLGISFLPSAVNYYLLRHDKAREIQSHLQQLGILLRDCSNFLGLDSSYMRVAVKSERDNVRILKEMALCMV